MHEQTTTALQESVFRWLFSYIRRYARRFLLAVILASLFGLFSASPAYLIQHMVDNVFVGNRGGLLVPFILAFIGLFIARAICMYYSTYYLNWVGYMVVNDIRRTLFSRLIYFPLSFFKRHSTGDLMSHFLNDITTLQYAASIGIRNGLRSLFEALALFGIAFYQNAPLTLLTIIVAPLIAIAIRETGKNIKHASQITQKDMGSVSILLQEALTGIKSIKAFNGEQREHNRFAHSLSTYFDSIMRCVHYDALGPAVIEVLAIIGCSIMLFAASHYVITGAITPGQLSALATAMLLAFQPIKRILSVYGDIHYGIGAAQRVHTLLKEGEQAIIDNSKPALPRCHGDIHFHNVSFSYREEAPLLVDISFSIAQGERVGLIGPSGAGKSTISDLLLKFVEPQAGMVMFDSHNIATYSTASIRSRIGYVDQHPFLFNDTVYANILYAAPEKKQQDVIIAAEMAGAHEFILSLPDGYQTNVGENGCKLSGGQKQRITIARALLRSPSLLIFDEATSALDNESEQLIKESILSIPRDISILVITHRPLLLESMDRVLVITEGRVVPLAENGEHVIEAFS